MRPYLAVIRDSFHEALASRVLWIILVGTTLVLLALLPLSIAEQAGWYLNNQDFLDTEALAAKLTEQGNSDTPSPGHAIWKQLSPGVRSTLEQQSEAKSEPNPNDGRMRRQASRQLEDELRALIQRREFYDAKDWANVILPSEARETLKTGLEKLPPDQLARFNRLALEAAYPLGIAKAGPKQIQLAYLSWDLGIPLPVSPEELYPAINQLVVGAMAFLLGVAGVFVAVLVTASIIPQTFEPGSVDLLLSKPIDRSCLFIAKFLGGCAFIAINAAYFIVGLWLILGLRLGLWNARLLWAIPLYLFLFAIYYSVSAFAGLVWRNAIVSVVMAVLFWLMCFSLGTANGLVDQLSLQPRRLTAVVPVGDKLLAVNPSQVLAWDDAAGDWQTVFAGPQNNELPFMIGRRLIGPVYDAANERILAFQVPMPGMPPVGPINQLFIGKQSDDWRRTVGVSVPPGSAGLFLHNAQVLVAASSGVYRLEGDTEAKQAQLNVIGIKIPLPQGRNGFQPLGPRVQLRNLEGAALDPQTGNVALFDGAKLVLLKPNAQGRYEQAAEQSFEPKVSGRVAAVAGQVFVAESGGSIKCYDADLKLTGTLETEINSQPESFVASADGHYLAVVFKNAQLWLYNLREKQPAELHVAGQGDITAVAFAGDKLYVADHLTRVTEYVLSSAKNERTWQPPMPLVEKVYRYALHPLYTVFPKPSQLNETVSYLLTSQDTKRAGLRFEEPAGPPKKVDIWGPVWSNLAFLVVVLGLACVYMYRKDF